MFFIKSSQKRKKSILKTDKNWENDSQTFKICQCTVYLVLNKIRDFFFQYKKVFCIVSLYKCYIKLKNRIKYM